MFVCVYVCVYVCMYVCMFVCMFVCMYVYMYVCMYICMYVCITIIDTIILTNYTNNAYISHSKRYKICERYLCEAVQGLIPSTTYIGALCVLYGAKEFSLCMQSVYMEDARLRLKKAIAGHTFKAFERDRLSALGRSDDVIERLFADVDGHCREMLALVEVGYTTILLYYYYTTNTLLTHY
jgi:hypothetical protein